MTHRFPERGAGREDVLGELESARVNDVRWKDGRAFSLVFYPGEEIYSLVRDAFLLYFSENALNPSAFPSLRKFETETAAMLCDLMRGGPTAAGNMTSGGTESILLAVYAAREWARKHKPDVTEPEILLPITAHPAFDKAAHYFGLTIKRIPLREDYRADASALPGLISRRTILIAGSAPQYPQGVVDPIAEMSEIARKNDILFHTDACVGGMTLPFVRMSGRPVPDFDFSLPGVTSISVDIHKYGYAAKGASVILYRDRKLRREQYFVEAGWTGGIYGSPGILGTRIGGSIAAAWAVIRFLGTEGYLQLTKSVMDTVDRIRKEVQSIPGLAVLSNPDGPVISLISQAGSNLDIYQTGDELQMRGWHLDKQQNPDSLHLTVSHAHVQSADDFLRDLRECAKIASGWNRHRLGAVTQEAVVGFLARVLPPSWIRSLSKLTGGTGGGRSAAMYGMIGSLPPGDDLRDIVLDFMDRLYEPPKK